MSLENFPEFALFLETNPGIPGLQTMIICNKYNLAAYTFPNEVVTFFANGEPKTALAKELDKKSFKIVGHTFEPVEPVLKDEDENTITIEESITDDDSGTSFEVSGDESSDSSQD